MLRHTAFFLHRDATTPDDRFEMLKGLAFLQTECEGPVAGDYGEDIFGGSKRLRDVKPWDRRPRWRGPEDGPPSSYDVALHLDFNNQAEMDAYNNDDVHHRIGQYNASINDPELTARIDWWYDGPPMTRRGLIRHSAMFVWKDEAGPEDRKRALDAVQALVRTPGVVSVVTGENVGTLKTDYDWLYDVQLTDREAAEKLLDSKAFADAMAAVAPATKHEWTARVTHVMRGDIRLPADRPSS